MKLLLSIHLLISLLLLQRVERDLLSNLLQFQVRICACVCIDVCVFESDPYWRKTQRTWSQVWGWLIISTYYDYHDKNDIIVLFNRPYLYINTVAWPWVGPAGPTPTPIWLSFAFKYSNITVKYSIK